MPAQYLTAAEVADVLRVKPQAVVNLCQVGALPAIKPLKSWLIRPADLDAYLEQVAAKQAAEREAS